MKVAVRKEEAYVTKRLIRRVSKTSIKKAFVSSMDAMGYVVMVEKGALVRLNADGTKEYLSVIKKAKRPSRIVLD